MARGTLAGADYGRRCDDDVRGRRLDVTDRESARYKTLRQAASSKAKEIAVSTADAGGAECRRGACLRARRFKSVNECGNDGPDTHFPQVIRGLQCGVTRAIHVQACFSSGPCRLPLALGVRALARSGRTAYLTCLLRRKSGGGGDCEYVFKPRRASLITAHTCFLSKQRNGDVAQFELLSDYGISCDPPQSVIVRIRNSAMNLI
ncbi:hypothetical protein EVAR_40002_1 [Eumeta japonica]|uniref:Uncharacterized protein n=1 Tax=Eumeta variegata TaxID=151549 RepID=A0A4C1ZQ57_EUMVA|nr:hypothetical protein EVAR_40002_1 [Eumeta japonica]